MNIEYYVDKIKFLLTGGVLESEISDEGYEKLVRNTLQELNRFYDSTQLVEVKTSERCIDLAKVEEENNIKINLISAIYRTQPNGMSMSGNVIDPITISMWNTGNGYRGFGSSNWALRYMAYNTANQIANTISTDLDFKEDKIGRKLYVNYSNGSNSTSLTLEYIPKLEDPEQVVGDYWIDILSRMSLAYAKIALGRIRTRYTQSDALWTQDGETMLTEGKEELSAIRERLLAQSNFSYPVD